MIEKNEIQTLDFEKQGGLIPAVIQDAFTGKVLMLGYMNEVSLEKTLAEKMVCFFSRSRQTLWTKGETSGNYLEVVDIQIDCDRDTLLIKAKPHGPVCHTGSDTCFEEKNQTSFGFLSHLASVIKDRRLNPSEKSYTTSLFNKGINKIAQKVGEEAVELIIEAKDNDDNKFRNECADLLYHLLILLEAKHISLNEVVDVLVERHK